MKKLTCTLITMTLALCLLAGCGKDAEASSENSAETTTTTESTASAESAQTKPSMVNVPAEFEMLTGKYNIVIDVEGYGQIHAELDADAAPVSVSNFVDLVNRKYYDGLTFHRIMEGFMMQGGDPSGTGSGGSSRVIMGEFAANGYENPISHKRGVLSMARSNNPNSASSQFFICHADSDFLDGNYAAFGVVTEGMEVVDAICTNAQPVDNNGTIPADKQPIINSITLE